MGQIADKYAAQIADIKVKIKNHQDLIDAIKADPNYTNIQNIFAILKNANRNSGNDWYYTDTQQWISGPTAAQQYNQWLTWLNQKQTAISAAQTAIDGYNQQLKDIAAQEAADPAYKNEVKAEEIKITYAQTNTKYFIIGGIVLAVLVIGVLVYVKYFRKQKTLLS